MRLDFSTLSSVKKDRGGQREQGGQPISTRDRAVPACEVSTGTLGTLQPKQAENAHESQDTPPMSPETKTDWGHEKPGIHAIVPVAPAVPKQKILSALTDLGPSTLLLVLHYRFRFDLVEEDIAEGYPAEDLDRVNNMVWAYMMSGRRIPTHEAFEAAAGVVVTCEPAPCEQDYVDMRALWHRLVEQEGSPPSYLPDRL